MTCVVTRLSGNLYRWMLGALGIRTYNAAYFDNSDSGIFRQNTAAGLEHCLEKT